MMRPLVAPLLAGVARSVFAVDGSAAAIVPTLQDSSETFGKLTASHVNNDKGQCDLADKMRLNRNGLTGSVTWEGELVSVTTGNSADFEVTAALTQTDYPGTGVGRTPYIPTSRWGTLSGTYVFRYRCKVGTSAFSSWATLTYVIDANGNTIGNDYSGDNFAGALFYAYGDGASAWTGGNRNFYYPPGLARKSHAFPNNLNFPGPTKAKVLYGDASRPVRMDSIILNNGQYISFDGIKGGVRSAAANGHVQLTSCTNCEVINSSFRRTRSEFVAADASQQFAGVLIAGSSDTILVDNCEFEHLFRGIYVAQGSNITLTNNRGCNIHGQPVFIGANGLQVDGVTDTDNTWWNPFRTQDPTVDVDNHLDWDQCGDADTAGVVAKNVTRRRNVYVMGEANSGVRGIVNGGNGANGNALPGKVDIQNNILFTWGPTGIEVFGYENASVVKGNAIFLMRSGSDATAPAGARKDEYAPTFEGLSVVPVSGTIGSGATMLLQDNFTYGTIRVDAAATGVTQTNNNAYARNLTGAGYVQGDPEAYMVAFTDWANLAPSDYATVRSRAMLSMARSDGKGPVNATGSAFN